MKSKYLSVVPAALACSMLAAQSGPTLYGVADLSVESVKAEGATAPGSDISSRTRLNANSSLLGIKGKVAMDNGATVIYQFETYIDLGNNEVGSANTPIINNGQTTKVGGLNGPGTGTVFGARRDTFLGLMGSWGTLKAGYLSTPFRATTASFDLAPGATGVATSYNIFGKATDSNTFFFRAPEVEYTTPIWEGLYGTVAYLVNSAKSADGNVDPYGWAASVNYKIQAFRIALVHTNLKDVGFGGAVSESNKSDAGFVSYTFPTDTTLTGMFQQYRGTITTGTPTAPVDRDIKQKSFYFGIKQVWGRHEIFGVYASAPDREGSYLSTQDSGATQVSLRYAYNMFKNTQAYAVYSRISNDANVAYNFDVGGIGNASSGAKVALGSDPTSIGIGLRHTF
ncbi:porin [Geothrix sp.]|uniref:porin n=1 Tax=Geothrix sp. TaxID=1962974 RepID=UPI0025B8135A|nr:porin [Geothrix sp.]